MDSVEKSNEEHVTETKDTNDETANEGRIEEVTIELNDEKLDDPQDGPVDEISLLSVENNDDKADTVDELEGGEVQGDEYMYYYDGDRRKTVTNSHFIPKEDRGQCQACSTSFQVPFSRRPHHCRRCGDVYCRPCLSYRKRLNVWAQPDSEGILCKVCKTCYGKTETVLCGVKRSLTEDFVSLRKQCKTERRHILCDVTIDRRNASIVPAFWREELQIDIPLECRRLLEGFKVAVGSSDTSKTLYELTDKIIVPSWQKAKFWTLESATLCCRQCGGQLKGKKFRNCRVCALAQCKKCSYKELLVYYEDGLPPGKDNEPRLAIIKVAGSPEKEPRYSLRLTICKICRDDLIQRQSKDHAWYSKISRPPDLDLMSQILEIDRTFRDLIAEIDQNVERLGEMKEIHRSPKQAKTVTPADNDTPESGDTDNSINSVQEIKLLKENLQDNMEKYYQLYQSLKSSISSLGKTAQSRELRFAKNYIQARNNSYITLKSRESMFKYDGKPA